MAIQMKMVEFEMMMLLFGQKHPSSRLTEKLTSYLKSLFEVERCWRLKTVYLLTFWFEMAIVLGYQTRMHCFLMHEHKIALLVYLETLYFCLPHQLLSWPILKWKEPKKRGEPFLHKSPKAKITARTLYRRSCSNFILISSLRKIILYFQY